MFVAVALIFVVLSICFDHDKTSSQKSDVRFQKTYVSFPRFLRKI